MPNSEELAALVQVALRRAGHLKRNGSGEISYYAAAKATGVHDVTLKRICSGQSSPSISTLERIFNAIGWDVTVSFTPRKPRQSRRRGRK